MPFLVPDIKLVVYCNKIYLQYFALRPFVPSSSFNHCPDCHSAPSFHCSKVYCVQRVACHCSPRCYSRLHVEHRISMFRLVLITWSPKLHGSWPMFQIVEGVQISHGFGLFKPITFHQVESWKIMFECSSLRTVCPFVVMQCV